ncbi:hypothetical protein BXZ70DRAFT_784115 [Cristinia sonorae]|uniref:Uncharacterized protein n=1 Tax=Cristinia sonorae TaxID=1940300 RepID=A0A8K0XRN4_9AGAR|nr:hypothetical protein BXZ70DRAFT_784115 [Cristinia sonorae]
MALQLPAELWLTIFQHAVGGDEIVDQPIPGSLNDSTWSKMLFGDWTLRTPEESFNILQRSRYLTLKSITATCKPWRRWATEFLFKILHFSNPVSIQRLCAVYDRDRHLGRLSRRLQVSQNLSGRRHTPSDLEYSLVPLIRHCTRLQVLSIDASLGESFGPIVDAFCTYCPKTLHTLRISVHVDHLARVIWMLDLLPSLKSLHLDFTGSPNENVELGAASGLVLTLRRLQQLSVQGFFTDFLEEASSWEFPVLQEVRMDFLGHRDDFPDIIGFLSAHGRHLTCLDINAVPSLDVPAILSRCSQLTTFCFNADWKLRPDPLFRASHIVYAPHPNITTIGCHQLLYAFGVNSATSMDPLSIHLIRQSNDRNFAALTKRNFPKLQRIRVLNKMLLRDLEASDGPDTPCYERWERWWDQCASQRISLEDCTGAPLGTLPEKDVPDEESVVTQEERPKDPFTVIRELVLECQRLGAHPAQLGMQPTPTF